MPGRHGAMRYKRNKSKRQRPDQMETTLKDSIHNARRKEQAILKELVPPKLKQVKRQAIPMGSRNTTALPAPRADTAPGVADIDPASVVRRLVALTQEGSQLPKLPSATLALPFAPLPSVDWACHRDDAPLPPNHKLAARAARKRTLRATNREAALTARAQKHARLESISAPPEEPEVATNEVTRKKQARSHRSPDKLRRQGSVLLGLPQSISVAKPAMRNKGAKRGTTAAHSKKGRHSVAKTGAKKKKVSRYKRKKN